MTLTTNEWVQPALFQPPVTELELRIGLSGAFDHLQWQASARSVTDDVLLYMQSAPHRPIASTEAELLVAMRLLRRLAVEYAGPF